MIYLFSFLWVWQEVLAPYYLYGARKAELSKIMPFDYIEIFFALILGWIFFREWPVDQLFPGALFIVAGGIIIYLRQKNSIKTRDRKAS